MKMLFREEWKTRRPEKKTKQQYYHVAEEILLELQGIEGHLGATGCVVSFTFCAMQVQKSLVSWMSFVIDFRIGL